LTGGNVYYITYKNILKPNKKLDDFKSWLKTNWSIQKKFGATSVKVWPKKGKDKRVVFCRYTIKNLDKWNKRNMSKEADSIVQTLEDLFEMDRMSLKISPYSTQKRRLSN